MNYRILLFYGFFTAMLFAGCSVKSAPPPSGEEALRRYISEQSKSAFKLASFRKTDGAAGEIFGVKIYQLTFEATVDVIEDCKWSTTYIGEVNEFHVADKSPPGTSQMMDSLNNPGIPLSSGKRLLIDGKLMLEKSEQGWNISDPVTLTKYSIN
jgi:hypothetical protein